MYLRIKNTIINKNYFHYEIGWQQILIAPKIDFVKRRLTGKKISLLIPMRIKQNIGLSKARVRFSEPTNLKYPTMICMEGNGGKDR